MGVCVWYFLVIWQQVILCVRVSVCALFLGYLVAGYFVCACVCVRVISGYLVAGYFGWLARFIGKMITSAMIYSFLLATRVDVQGNAGGDCREAFPILNPPSGGGGKFQGGGNFNAGCTGNLILAPIQRGGGN